MEHEGKPLNPLISKTLFSDLPDKLQPGTPDRQPSGARLVSAVASPAPAHAQAETVSEVLQPASTELQQQEPNEVALAVPVAAKQHSALAVKGLLPVAASVVCSCVLGVLALTLRPRSDSLQVCVLFAATDRLPLRAHFSHILVEAIFVSQFKASRQIVCLLCLWLFTNCALCLCLMSLVLCLFVQATVTCL